MNKQILVIIIGLLLCLFLFIRTPKKRNVAARVISGESFIEDLDGLGYFKYTSPAERENVKEEMKMFFDDNHYISSPIADYRKYIIDGETLFESTGLPHYLSVLKASFDKMGIPLEWSNETEEINENYLDHRITINGVEYTAYSGSLDNSNLWGVAWVNFIEMLNDQLQRSGSNERIYPMWGNNEESIIMLTPELFQYLETVKMERDSGPKTVEWLRKRMKL